MKIYASISYSAIMRSFGRATSHICPRSHHQRQYLHGACAGGTRWVAKSALPSSKLSTLLDTVTDPEHRVLNVDRYSGNAEDIVAILSGFSVSDILTVVDTKEQQEGNTFRSDSVLGNDKIPRYWKGPFESVPAYMGQYDVIICSLIHTENLRDDLLRSSLSTRPGGSIVLWSTTPGVFSRDMLEKAVCDLCIDVVDVVDGSSSSVAHLMVPKHYAFSRAPLYMKGKIVHGYGRGSKELGVPTANLSVPDVQDQIAGLPLGVYFGWAQLVHSSNSDVHKMVMNIGKRPTFVKDNSPDSSVEAHVMHTYEHDFYGETMKVLLVGYLRPEMPFSGLEELLRRIHTDIGISRTQLDSDRWSEFAQDPFFDPA